MMRRFLIVAALMSLGAFSGAAPAGPDACGPGERPPCRGGKSVPPSAAPVKARKSKDGSVRGLIAAPKPKGAVLGVGGGIFPAQEAAAQVCEPGQEQGYSCRFPNGNEAPCRACYRWEAEAGAETRER